MGFDRRSTKRELRAALAAARPRPMFVTFVYVLVSVLLPAGAVALVWLFAGAGRRPEAAPAALLSVLSVLAYLFSMLLSLGYTRYSMKLARGEETGCGDLLDGFGMAWCAIRTILLVSVKTLLWVLPVYFFLSLGMAMLLAAGMMGVLPMLSETTVSVLSAVFMVCITVYFLWVYLRYALTFFFLLDHPEEGARRAVRRSVEAMRGQKLRLLTLGLSFLGWALLVPLTLGILGLWLTPYMAAAGAGFYDCVSGRGGRTPPAESGYIPFGA